MVASIYVNYFHISLFYSQSLLLYAHCGYNDYMVITVTVRRRHGYKKIVDINAGPGIDDTTHSHYIW